MGIVYEERNGRTYVYRVSSKRVPGRKSPVCRKEYLGVLDAETGMMRPKSVPVSQVPLQLREGEFRSLDCGGVLLCVKAAESTGLIEDLEAVFGDAAPVITAMSVCRVLSPSFRGDYVQASKSLYLDGVLGHGRGLSESGVRKAFELMDRARVSSFFERRGRRAEGRVYVFGHPASVTGLSSVTLYKGEVAGAMGAPYFLMISDGRCVPLYSGLYYRPRRGLEAGQDGGEPVQRAGAYRSTVVVQEEFGGADVMAKLLMKRVDVVMEYNPDLGEIAGYSFSPDEFWEEAERVAYRGRRFLVQGFPLCLVYDGDGWMFSLSDASHGSFAISAFVFCDVELNRERAEVIRSFLRDGGSSDRDTFFLLGVDGLLGPRPREGRASRERAARSISGAAGTFIVLSTSADWRGCLDAISVRTGSLFYSEHMVQALAGGIGGAKFKPREFFVDFLAVSIRMRIEVAASDSGIEGEDVLGDASSYRAVVQDNFPVLGEKSERAERVLSMFGPQRPDCRPLAVIV